MLSEQLLDLADRLEAQGAHIDADTCREAARRISDADDDTPVMFGGDDE